MHWICPSLKIKENQTPWGVQVLFVQDNIRAGL